MAFQQGLSGLNTSSKALDVTGNNIANASTVGFKGAATHFARRSCRLAVGWRRGSRSVSVSRQRHRPAIHAGQHHDDQQLLDIAINGNGFFSECRKDGA